MKTSIAKIVGEFRSALVPFHSTFFLIYTDIDKPIGAIKTVVTSNSTPEGITAILSLVLEPSEAAVALLVKALPRPDWFSSRAKREKQARAVLDQLRCMFVVAKMDAKPVVPSKPVLVQ
jgi:hypothetical protein